MGADKEIKTVITAEPDPFVQAMKEVERAARAAFENVGKSVESIASPLEAVRKHFAALTAILAGGAIFRESVDVAKDFTGQVTQLSKQLGISAAEASGLNVALESIGSDADAYTSALSKLTKQVRTNEKGLNAMGIATRDSNGHYLDGRALMDSAIGTLKAYKEGTDRNLAAQVAFGKGAQEAAALLKLNNEVQEEGAKKAAELNLIIGPENQAAVKAYKVGMIEVKEVLLAIENTIGQAMIPVLTKIAEWFSGVGPAAISVFKPVMGGIADVLQIVTDALIELWDIFSSAFKGILQLVAYALTGDGSISSFGSVCSFVFDMVKVALLALEMGFNVVFGTIGTVIEVASAYLRRFGTTAELALRGKWPEAKAAWVTGTAEIEQILDKSGDRMINSAKRIHDKINAITLGQPPAVFHASDNYGDGPEKGKRYNGEGSEKKEPSRVPQWEAELAEFKLHEQEMALAEGRFYEMSKSDEQKFWQDKLATTTAGTAENAAVRKKNAELGLAVQKDAFDTELQGLKTQADAYKNNLDAKLAIVEQEATIIGQKYGLESKEYKAVQGEIVKIKREAVAQQVQLEDARQEGLRQIALSEIDVQQQAASARLALGLITQQQMLQLERQFEDARTKIALDAQNARITAMRSDPDHSEVALQKEKDQLLAVERQHQQAVAKISQQIAVEQTTDVRNYVTSLEQQFGSVFEQLLTRQTTFTAASRKLMQGLATSSGQFAMQILQKQVATWLSGNSIYQAIMGAKAGTDASAAATTIAVKATESDAVVTSNAAEAASGAAASVASTPYVGWALAAAAFAAVLAMVLGAKGGGGKSAAGGFDIPKFTNPMVQTHAEEMILPAKHANVIRGLADNGGAGGGGDVHLHVHAIDAKSVTKLFSDNGAAIAASLRQQRRMFNPV